MKNKRKIIIFDGICNLCNKSIGLIITLDKEKQFKYTSLQGEYVKNIKIKEDINSIIFYEDGMLYYKSTAILKIFKSLGGVWVFTNISYVIPRFLRDIIYDFIAKYRYKIFGRMQSCRIPKKDEQALFME